MTSFSGKIEEVVLLDDHGKPCGTMNKAEVHTMDTPLHSAFSVFIFDKAGHMLTQQRALTKKTWPGIWSNACCGHPAPGESHVDAAQRRLWEELGATEVELTMALPDFRYRAIHKGVMENEICPVLIGFFSMDQIITPNATEVEAIKWVSAKAFFDACDNPRDTEFESFSPWSLMEGRLLKSTPWFNQVINQPE